MLGEVRRPSIADLFVAVMSPHLQKPSASASLRRDEPAGQADKMGAAK
jgi:hypothetical protein